VANNEGVHDGRILSVALIPVKQSTNLLDKQQSFLLLLYPYKENGKKLQQFAGQVGRGCSVPLYKFTRDMLTGMVAKKSILLSDIGRALNEDTELLYTEKRLSRNLPHSSLNDSAVRENYLHTVRRDTKNSVIAFDLSDVRKEYSKDQPYLAGIWDSSLKEKTRGYWLTMVEAIGSNGKHTPLWLKAWSQKMPEFISQNAEIIETIHAIAAHADRSATWVFDRGFDSAKIVSTCESARITYVIRQVGKRSIFGPDGEKESTYEAASKIEMPYRFAWRAIRHSKTYANECRCGSALVTFPDGEKRQLLVMQHSRYREPVFLLSNCPTTDRDTVIRLCLAYLRRWSIEAVALDPNFAQAYATIGLAYSNLGQASRANEYLSKAFALRDRVSEAEKLYIAASYYELATGNLPGAMRTYQEWTQAYPRDDAAFTDLSVVQATMGQYEKAIENAQVALNLYPAGVPNYENLADFYLATGKTADARTILKEAEGRHLDDLGMRQAFYALAFLAGDEKGMQEQVAWAQGKEGMDDMFLSIEADTAAFSGRLKTARGLSAQAVDSAKRAKAAESAALWQSNSAIREALLGNVAEARKQANAALALAPDSRYASAQAALALAVAGDTPRPRKIADNLAKSRPDDTLMQSLIVPAVKAAAALGGGKAEQAVAALQAALPYELGIARAATVNSCVYPAYLRGEAYLAMKQGAQAAVEFEKLLDHPGIVQNCVTGPLARLGIARAYAEQGNQEQARAAYQNFLKLWKDADPDIPIYHAAKAEYAKLR
jgi:tetratricopeptide (TPR) repeat protein